MHVRVDERGREHEARALDHTVAVPLQRRAELCDHAIVDPNVDHRVDTVHRVEHAGACDDQALSGCVFADEHHATSWISAAV